MYKLILGFLLVAANVAHADGIPTIGDSCQVTSACTSGNVVANPCPEDQPNCIRDGYWADIYYTFTCKSGITANFDKVLTLKAATSPFPACD
jgi:hypothetical protein